MVTIEQPGLVWRKSSRSGATNNDCVEVALFEAGSAIRDSKNPDGAALTFDAFGWSRFIEVVKQAE